MNRTLLLQLLWMLGGSEAHAEDPALLFLGNSYTAGNSLPDTVALLLAGIGPAAHVAQHTPGGYRLPQHLADIEGGNAQVATWMTPGTTTWTTVVLQDQSQIPGFSQSTPEWVESRDAMVPLHAHIGAVDADTVLFLTWGRRSGDPLNPDRYPDFSTMQDRLTEGILAYADAAATPERPVYIAPVGEAWRIVHDETLAAGADPLASEALFSRLYANDGSHPSSLGTTLTSLVFVATLSGTDPTELVPQSAVSPDDLTRLQQAARQAVLEDESGRFLFPYQREVSAPEETDAPPSTDTDAEALPPASPVPSGGCGCAGTPSLAPGWSLFYGLFARS